jgi:predicted metal-binding protein
LANDAAPTVSLHICVTCGHPDEPRPGLTLHDNVAALMSDAEPFTLKATKCLSRCGEGCGLAVTAPGKWGYLLSRLSPDLAADILTYARAYAAHETGALLPSRRPESLRNVVVGRIPAMETAA